MHVTSNSPRYTLSTFVFLLEKVKWKEKALWMKAKPLIEYVKTESEGLEAVKVLRVRLCVGFVATFTSLSLSRNLLCALKESEERERQIEAKVGEHD